MATINIIDVKKNYGAVPAVKGINLCVADGELIVLVGPSGCGKSTLLRMIAGLEIISEGAVEIAGRNVNQGRARRARHRHGVSELCALSAYDRTQEPRIWPRNRR